MGKSGGRNHERGRYKEVQDRREKPVVMEEGRMGRNGGREVEFEKQVERRRRRRRSERQWE